MTNKITKKANKGGTIATYVIALVCLIAGLFVPLYGTAEQITDKMLFMYLPDALNVALGNTIISGDWVKAFTETTYPLIFGMDCNIYAWTLVIYAVLTVIGIIFLAPVIAGNKRTSAVFAYILEVAVALDLAVYLIFTLYLTIEGSWSNFSVLIAFGGAIVMLIIQSFMNKKSLGVCKFFLFLLSILGLISLYDVTLWVTALAEPFENIASSIGLTVGFAGARGIDYFFAYGLNVQQLGTLLADLTINDKVLVIALLAATTLTVINFIIDIIGLSTLSKYDKDGIININKGSKVFAFIRYLLEFLAIVVAIIMMLVVKQTIGIYLYLLAIVAIIQLIISIVRLCLIKSAKRKAKKAKQELTTSTDYSDESDSSSIDEGFWSEQSESKANDDAEEAQSESEQQEAYTTAQAEPVEDEQTTMDIAEAQPVQEKQQENETYEAPEALTDSGEQMQIPVEQTNDTVTEETHTIVYNVKRVYNGPTDKFMDTLTESEKIEFVKVFIEKSKGTLPRIPDYEIGGDNAEFFPAVFIYLGKIRGLISAGLLAKIYKQLNLMN